MVTGSTTLSTGEYTPIAGVTSDKTHQKHECQEFSIGPRLIILDSQPSLITPLGELISSGIRAMDHCIESLCSIRPSRSGDEKAERGLRLLIPWLPRTQKQPRDLEARLTCPLGVVEAIAAPLERVPMGASHAIGHQLGPTGVSHEKTSCILMPAVARWNTRVNEAQQEKVLKSF